ncbi:hypothetical protein Tco_0749489 [Tanacetum coccineum]|uniref:Uncharacterized protein n=1 Tax=Tanacetum coccineum TaxID=301880 RepID=A0ABQ4YYK1_9ASTR
MKATMAWRCRACDGFGEELLIIMVNVIPPDHVDDVPIVEPNQHDDVPVIPEPVLVDEDEDPEEDEFEEEEDPQEEEDDMEVDPLNPPSPASESEPEDTIEVKNPIKFEDETVLASVHEVGESSTAPFLQWDSDGLISGLMRRENTSLLGDAFFYDTMCGLQDGACIVKRKERKGLVLW